MKIGVVEGELIIHSDSSDGERVIGELQVEVIQKNNKLNLRLVVDQKDGQVIQVDLDSINTQNFLALLNEAEFATESELY